MSKSDNTKSKPHQSLRTPRNDKSYKPYISRGHGRFRSRYGQLARKPYNCNYRSGQPYGDNQNIHRQGRSPFRRSSSHDRMHFRCRLFDHSPNAKKPRVALHSISWDHERCFICHNISHWAYNCLHATDDGQNANMAQTFPGLQQQGQMSFW